MTMIILLLILLSVFSLLVFVFIIIPFAFGASFEPTKREDIETTLKFADAKMGEKFADLGSGDGRFVIAFAKKGVESHGYEVNPLLVLFSRRKIRKLKLEKKAFIHWKNFWKANLKEFDIVNIFQIGYLMRKMEKKLDKELRKGSRIISNKWRFPNLKCERSYGVIHLYRV